MKFSVIYILHNVGYIHRKCNGEKYFSFLFEKWNYSETQAKSDVDTSNSGGNYFLKGLRNYFDKKTKTDLFLCPQVQNRIIRDELVGIGIKFQINWRNLVKVNSALCIPRACTSGKLSPKFLSSDPGTSINVKCFAKKIYSKLLILNKCGDI